MGATFTRVDHISSQPLCIEIEMQVGIGRLLKSGLFVPLMLRSVSSLVIITTSRQTQCTVYFGVYFVVHGVVNLFKCFLLNNAKLYTAYSNKKHQALSLLIADNSIFFPS